MEHRKGSTLIVALLALFLSACTPPPSGEKPNGDGEADAGGTLVIAQTGDIDNLDPHVATAFQTYRVLELSYDTLFDLDPELNVIPGLAEDHQYSDDGRTLTLTLREDVTFHDDDTFDSEDVKASLERILDEDTAAVARSNLLSIESIATPDPETVELALTEPDSTLPAALADLNTAILSATAIEAGTVANKPNGTGAFVFEKWNQGQSVDFTANPGYWREGPFLDAVEVRVIPDESSILAGLRAGEFQLGVMTDPAVVSEVGDDRLKVESTPALAYHALMLNNTRAPLDDRRVRKAISCAIDRQEVIDSAVFGEGELTGPFTTPAFASPPFEGLGCEPPEIDMARQLLTEAGHPDGFTLETIVITGEGSTSVDEAQSMKSQLAEIGVKLDLQVLETNVYVDRWLAADFDASVSRNGGRPDPHQMYARYFTSDGNLNDVATFDSPELDRLFESGIRATDSQEREAIYDQISGVLLDASPWVWLFAGYEYRVLAPGVEGFVPMPTGSIKSVSQVRLTKGETG
jgi:peptide/nickel transport system substrate-binding protein